MEWCHWMLLKPEKWTDGSKSKQTNKQTDRKKKFGVEEKKCDCGFQQTTFLSSFRSMKRHKVLVSSSIALDLCKIVSLKKVKKDGTRRKDFLFIRRQVNCENLCQWILESEVKWQGQTEIFRTKKHINCSEKTSNSIETATKTFMCFQDLEEKAFVS